MSSATSSRLQTMPPPLQQQHQQQPTLPLHRVRFFDHTPSPITALAFAPTPLTPAQEQDASAKGKGKLGAAQHVNNGASGAAELGVLVVARDSGDVEVWGWVEPEGEGQGNWVLEKVLPPTLTHPGVSLMCLVLRDPTEFQHKPYKVPRLADLTLYTAGSDSSDITERCLYTGRILQTYTIPSPPLWAMSVSPTHQYLCLATTSPTLHFLSITPSGLEPPPAHLLRSDALPSRTRTVSIAWGPPRPVKSSSSDTYDWRDTYLVTGNSDSSFRKFDLLPPDASRPGAGRVALSDRAVVEKQSKGARKNNAKGTIVWGVAVLPDHTVVTADSLGTVAFWDGASMAQKQTFRAHKADAMCMAISADGRAVFTSGPDQRVCQFVRLDKATSTSTGGSGSAGEWALTTTKRTHAHDVRALACFPAYTPALPGVLSSQLQNHLAPVLASGGWDMSLVLTPCAAPNPSSGSIRLRNPLGRSTTATNPKAKVLFEESYPRKMSYLGGARGTSLISISRSARLVLGRKERSVGIWKVHSDEQGWDKLLDMDFRLRTALTCAVISEDGRWMAVSDLYETKLFALRSSSASTGMGSLAPKRIKSFLPTLLQSKALKHLELESRGTGASSLLFSPDSGRLIMGMAMSGQVVILELNGGEGQVKGEEVRVAQVFKRDEAMVGQAGRVIVPMKDAAGAGAAAGKGAAPRRQRRRARKQVDSDAPAAVVVNGDAHAPAEGEMEIDQEAEDPAGPATEQEKEKEGREDDESSSEEENEEDEEGVKTVGEKQGRVASMAVSADGQWLAVSDLLGKVSIYNLDTLRPHATLPTFPSPPIALLSPPSHPSLFAILLPTQSVAFYDAESRALLQPTAQISKLNKALGDQFSAVGGAAFEPAPSAASAFSLGEGAGVFGGLGLEDGLLGSGQAAGPPVSEYSAGSASFGAGTATGKVDGKNVRLVVWSQDWVCSARLDLDMVSKQGQTSRRRRARGSAPAAAAAATDALQNGIATGPSAQPQPSAQSQGPDAQVPGGVQRLSRKRRAQEAREARDALERSSLASSPSTSAALPNGGNGTANGTSSIPPSPLASTPVNGHGHGHAYIIPSPSPAGSLANGISASGHGHGGQAHHPSSAQDPDFYRFTHDAFRSLAAVDWLGNGEMMVVERPMGDFVRELPGAFFVGTYGRG